jgi:pilus assembly protein CpaF
LRAIREQIAGGFDLVIHLARLVDGSRRISHVTEVQGLEGDVVTMQDVFIARPPREVEPIEGLPPRLLEPLAATGLRPRFLGKLATNGVTIAGEIFVEHELLA